MILTDEQKTIVLRRLQELWPIQKPCPVCGKQEWTVFDRLMELREFNKGSLYVGGPGGMLIPLVVLGCGSCGHAIFFNALVLKLLDPKTGSITK